MVMVKVGNLTCTPSFSDVDSTRPMKILAG